MDNNTSLMLIDNNASFEMDHVDASHNNPMALARPSTDDGLLPQPGIRRRRRKKSMVWEHFTIETTRPGSSKACCKHCRKSFAYITGQKLAGTSHLKCHILLGRHPPSAHPPPPPPLALPRNARGLLLLHLSTTPLLIKIAATARWRKMIIMHD
ncbi:hypothetical protein F2Q69_00048909 [Brassica cretica]|uniref:BED-type domain-containing protein n=1 Tax=Brassica cretica TaxID=69181 RepID=A0A8S9PS80_BRACR|nr:hypothetical protein F2Q69_00048909 [Brassica cretica]